MQSSRGRGGGRVKVIGILEFQRGIVTTKFEGKKVDFHKASKQKNGTFSGIPGRGVIIIMVKLTGNSGGSTLLRKIRYPYHGGGGYNCFLEKPNLLTK